MENDRASEINYLLDRALRLTVQSTIIDERTRIREDLLKLADIRKTQTLAVEDVVGVVDEAFLSRADTNEKR